MEVPASVEDPFSDPVTESVAGPDTLLTSIDLPPASCAADVDVESWQTFDTTVQFAESIQAASTVARRDGKPLFLMHVSGNFKMPEFT